MFAMLLGTHHETTAEGATLASRLSLLVPAGITFVCFLLFYGITARGALQTSDESAMFATGASVAMRGTLAIDDLEWLNDHVNLGKKGPDGHLYC